MHISPAKHCNADRLSSFSSGLFCLEYLYNPQVPYRTIGHCLLSAMQVSPNVKCLIIDSHPIQNHSDQESGE